MPEPLQVTQILRHLPDQFYCVAFSTDGETIATAGDYGTVKLWNVATRQLLHDFTGHRARVRSVTFAPDGKTLASASDDATVKLWDVATHQLLHSFEGHQDVVNSVAFAPQWQDARLCLR